MILPHNWHLIEDPEGLEFFTAELERELCEGHKLFGINGTIYARREPFDDCIFKLEDGTRAFVHLTWQKETSPKWPMSEVFESLEECVQWIDISL